MLYHVYLLILQSLIWRQWNGNLSKMNYMSFKIKGQIHFNVYIKKIFFEFKATL